MKSEDSGTPVGKFVLFPVNFEQSPCEMCGKCCNNDWIVEMSAEEFQRYRTFFEDSGLPEKLGECFQELKKDGTTVYRLLPHNGRCMFLLPDNKCFIHDKYGPEVKSRTCKNYPLGVQVFSPRGMHLRTSFICPSILKSLLRDDKIAIKRIAMDNDIRCSGAVRFSGEYHITWDIFFTLTDSLSGLFLQKRYSVEQNLTIAGLWASNLLIMLKKNRMEDFHEMCGAEYLHKNKEALLDSGRGFSPQYDEQTELLSNIAHVLMVNEFAGKGTKNNPPPAITRLLETREAMAHYRDSIRETYDLGYREELTKLSPVIERYLLHKVLSFGIFLQNGVIYGINNLALCYAFIRLYVLAEMIIGKKKLNKDLVLEAVSFVELIFFHRRSMEYLTTPQITNILSRPILTLLLVRM